VPEQLLLGDDHSGSGLLSLLAGSGLGPEDARAYAEVLRQPGAMTAALHWYRAMAWDDLLEIRPVIVPTLYVWPSEDPAFGRQAALATEECVAGYYQFAELPGVNHWVPETVPEQLSELLLPHIASA
jgi:pimeloyl-ACP methyl ester carboxylesterase